MQQQRFSPIQRNEGKHPPVDWVRVGIVAFILVAAVAVNVIVNLRFNAVSDPFPFLGATVWIALGLARGPWPMSSGSS